MRAIERKLRRIWTYLAEEAERQGDFKTTAHWRFKILNLLQLRGEDDREAVERYDAVKRNLTSEEAPKRKAEEEEAEWFREWLPPNMLQRREAERLQWEAKRDLERIRLQRQ